MAKCKVELLPAAYSDLDEIFDHILMDNQKAAARMLDSIMQSLQRLEDFPHSGKLLQYRSLGKYGFRMVIVEPYIAFYRFIDNIIYVYRILHGARDYPPVLKDAVE